MSLKFKNKKTKFIIGYGLIIIFLIVFIYSTYKIIYWKIDEIKTNKQLEELNNLASIEESNTNPEDLIVNPPDEDEEEQTNNDYWDYIKIPLINVNFDDLLIKNSDTVGWLFVDGTNINYPVVQSKNNSYYLYHSFDKSKNYAGWIFADYRNNMVSLGKNTIIYGHGRLDKTMFGTLKYIVKSSWFKDTENHIVKLSTPTENTLWQVFSVYHIPTESYYITTDFGTDESFELFINTMKERSFYNFEATVNKDDKVLTLSTCWNKKERVVLHAKLIKTNEKR
ncbi:MAG TPA: class B sortase [Bacilli bacterium]|nr:class B sortase [Bacilli bacterium]